MKVSKVDTYYFCILLFLFQPVIERVIGPFKYYDEMVVLLAFLYSMVNGKMPKRNYETLFLFLALTIIGLIGNYFSESTQIPIAILQDFLSNAKMVLFAIAACRIRLGKKQKRKLNDRLAVTIRLLFALMLFLAVVSQLVDIGMTENIRYGFKSFQFVYHNPAGLNTYFYLYMIIHSATLMQGEKLRSYSNAFTIIGVLAWMSTMRSRAIAFGVIYLALYVYIIHIRKTNAPYRFHWYHVMVAGAGAASLGWDAIEKYFIANDRTARYQLSRTSIFLARKYFPFGTGFGTFGTEASRAYYSNIYYNYGLSAIWGLNPDHPSYITDQYWFAILAQFGVIGTVVMAIIIYRIYKEIWRISKPTKPMQLAALTLFFTSIFASMTAGTFIQASIIPSIMVFYLFRHTVSPKCK